MLLYFIIYVQYPELSLPVMISSSFSLSCDVVHKTQNQQPTEEKGMSHLFTAEIP